MKLKLKKKEVYEIYRDLFRDSDVAHWHHNIVELAKEDDEFKKIIFHIGVSALIGYAKNRL